MIFVSLQRNADEIYHPRHRKSGCDEKERERDQLIRRLSVKDLQMRMARIKSRPPAASVLSQGVPDVPAALQVLLCRSARDAVRGRERGGGLDLLERRRRGGEVTRAQDSF